MADRGLARSWSSLRDHVRREGVLALARELLDAFRSNNLLTYASAISYQLLFALVPTALATVAILGFLDLGNVWSEDLAPPARDRLSNAAFSVLDSTVQQVLGERQRYWLTFGALFALWQVAAAARIAMRALNDVYGSEDRRSFLHRLLLSLGLAATFLAGVTVVAAALQVAPRLGRGGAAELPIRIGAWAFAFVVLVGLAAILLRLAPVRPHERREWLPFTTVLVVVGWLGATAAFGSWITWVVSYGAIYGGLAAAILAMTYVYLLVLVLLAGVQLETLVRAAPAVALSARVSSSARGRATGDLADGKQS